VTDHLKITDLDLHAYIDGELDDDRARAVEGAAARDAALAERLAAYRADKEMLKNIYAPLADRPIPPEWITLARATPPARARQSWRLVGAIAAMVLVILGGLSVYVGRHSEPSRDVVATALNIRDNGVAAQKSVVVTSLDEARRYDTDLRKIVGADVKVPALDSLGYHIAELRFYERAAEVQYRNRQGALFTLYLRPSDGTTRFDQFKRDGLWVCVWQDDRVSTVMAGPMSAALMQRLASLTYLGLTT
jgi:anti-sigma factor RsiW